MAGLYEQIINQLFKAKLEKYDRKIYHIGMKEIGRDEAIQYLSRYLYALIQSTIDDVAQQENGVENPRTVCQRMPMDDRTDEDAYP